MSYAKKILDNGIRVIVSPMPGTRTITLLVLVGTGSKYETKKINGISHFLEHLFFKGTKHRPKAGEVNKALDRLGAEHNAFTSKEVTGYWVKAADKHFKDALDIVSDILLEPLFKKEEMERERGVILQEISMYEDMPQRKVLDLWDDVLYGDQPAGWDVAGTKETVNSIKRSDVLAYRNSQYVGSNTVVVIAGNVDRDIAFNGAKEAFEKMPRGKPRQKSAVSEKQNTPLVKIRYKDSDQTHLVLGVRSYNMFDERRFPLNLLSVMLGGNMSSRLFMEIRERLGLAYYIGASTQQYTDSGYLFARAGIPHGSLTLVARKITGIMSDFRKRGITKKELSFAKDFLRGSMALSLESSDEVAMFYGEQELFYQKILELDDIWKKIEKIKEDDILKIAKDVFRPTKIALTAIGPHKKQEELLEKILSKI
jgi:predicted Zn-dependent peptidase